ncbi:YDG domain-containing protein [uncultured Clostridium sp.]|uniref:YDG domain-containing protein n=1 Tax=uncultured Clostridium sp. TaxID=59620 RepID=UPI00265FF264|nr:YDG domain-containing protein [uncultured Clostridium sp.]
MKKKYKCALAAALAAVMIWNTCDWHPQALAGSSVQYIEEVKELSDEILHQEVPYGTKYKDLELPDKLKVRVLAEEAPDEEDSAEDKDGAEKIATPSELQSGDGEVETEKRSQTLSSSETDGTVRKASPSEVDVIEKSEIGEDDTEQKASPSDADGTKTDKNWKEVKVRWVLDETFSEKDTYDGKTPGIYVFDAELKSSRYELDTGFLPRIEVTVLPEEKGPAIIGFSELDEAVAVQKLPLGAKESDIVLPDTLEVELEEADETLAEDSQNVHLVEAVDKDTEKDTEAETAVWQISGITWKLDEEQSDLPEFHGGISEKDYFEEFDENGEPVETSTKTWAGYAEENQEYNGRVYVYSAVLPEELGKFEVADTADLPEIYVMVGDAGMALLSDVPYNLNENYLVINEKNVDWFNGKTITGTYHPTKRLSEGRKIEGGIVIDDVTVNLTIEDVNVGYGTDIIDDAAGILLKGKAKLNLTVKGENSLKGTYGGAGIGVEEKATLIITKESTGSLTATGGGYGAAGIGGRATVPDYENTIISYKTGTIEIQGGNIHAVGGDYWFRGSAVRLGGAGIGTGMYGIGGTVRILGGTVKAEGGRETGAGIGGGDNGAVDSIQIGEKNGEAPEVEASSYNVQYGAAIGSGRNAQLNLKLSCGTINIFSGNLKVKGNIGYGGIDKNGDNKQIGGSVDISEQVKLELTDGTIEPRGTTCTFGKKAFQMTVYDNQLSDGTYSVKIRFYQEGDTARGTPVYETDAEMIVSEFKGTIPAVTEWLGFTGKMSVVAEVTDSQNNTVTETGTAVLQAGKDENVPVTLGKEAYKKTLDLTIYDGRLKNNQEYTLTVQVGEQDESGVLPDILSYSNKNASNYQISAGKVSWYSSLQGEEIPVIVTIQESGENGTAYQVSGTLTLESKEETALSLSIGEKLYPVHFVFFSSQVQDTDQVKLRAKRTDAAGTGNSVELNKELGQFAFDGKLVKDTANDNSAVATAYLPAGEYQFEIETGIAGLGESNGQFTLNQKKVNADEAGTEIVVLNEMQAFEGVLDLSQGDITFSEQGGNLVISHYQKEADSTGSTLKTIPGQSYETVYTIVTSEENTAHLLKINTSAAQDVKLVVKGIHLQASETAAQDAAPIQINGSSHVLMYLEGENKIQVQQTGTTAPAGISVAEKAQITIDCKPDADGSLEVVSQARSNSGAAIGGAPEADAGTIIINGGTVTAKLSGSSYAAAIGASFRKSVQKIQINGGTVTAEVKENSGLGAAIGSGSSINKKDVSTAQIHITGGKINVHALYGAGIGSGSGSNAQVQIDGGMITARSWKGASVGSGYYGSSEIKINGGSFCLDKSKLSDTKISDIGSGASGEETEVIINGGTFYMLNNGSVYNSAPRIRSLKADSSGNLNLESPLNGTGTPVYATKADLSSVYGADGVIKNASIDVPSCNYGFKDAQTAPNGIVYMYLPAADLVKATFSGINYEGKVKADAAKNELERELISVDYGKELLKNNLQSAVEFAQSKDASSWTEIQVNGAASLTEILDSQPEGTNEISLYVRKKADTSGAVGTATEIKIPARPETPAKITKVTKTSYSIKIVEPTDAKYEYGIAATESGEPQWRTEKTFTSPTPANTYYVTLRVKATDSSFASKPADRLKVTTPDALLIDGPAGAVSFEAKGTYGQTLAQIPVKLAEGFRVVNYRKTVVPGTWHFIESQGGMSASSIYPEVKGTTAYQVEFIPDKASEGQYGESLTKDVVPEISPKELTAVITTPIVKDYDRSTGIALEATVEIEIPGQSSGQRYTISGLRGSFEDANAGTGKTVIIDSSEAKVETGESGVNLQNYRIIYPAQTGTIRPIQGSVSIDQKAWTREKTYGDDSFSLTGVKVVGDGALKYESSDEKVLTVDAQGQVTIKGTGSADVIITMENGRNYFGTTTPVKRTINIHKGTLALILTAVNRTTGAKLSKGILGTEEEDFDIIASVQGVYQDKLQGYIHFYDNENPDADIVSVGEDGTAVLKWTKPGESLVGTHTIKAEFGFGEFNTWESRYNTPTPASLTFEISKAAPPAEDKPEDSDKPDNSDKSDQSGSQSSSSGRDKYSGSGVTRQDPVKGRTNSIIGILTGTANSTANDGKSHWMQDEHGWWLRFADSSYPKAEKRGTSGIAYAWEQVNGNWWAFDESGYIKTGWMRDEDYNGWFYFDPEHGMQTGWVLIDGKWYYFHPTSDGMKGLMYAGRRTPDGYYVDENGVWDGREKQ